MNVNANLNCKCKYKFQSQAWWKCNIHLQVHRIFICILIYVCLLCLQELSIQPIGLRVLFIEHMQNAIYYLGRWWGSVNLALKCPAHIYIFYEIPCGYLTVPSSIDIFAHNFEEMFGLNTYRCINASIIQKKALLTSLYRGEAIDLNLQGSNSGYFYGI